MSTRRLLKIMGPLIVIVLALAIAGVMIFTKSAPEKMPMETKPILVEAHPVYRTDTQFIVHSQGNVSPKNQTRLSSQVSGNVVQIAPTFEVGNRVQKGDVLAVLEQEDYETELRLAEAELARAEAALDEEIARGRVAETQWRSVNTPVPPELGLRKPQLAMEQANVKGAKAKYAMAKRNLARTELRAPYNAIVVERAIDFGQFVPIGAQVGTLYSTDIAEIRLPIIESELPFINLQSDLSHSTAIVLKAEVAGSLQQWPARLVRSEGVFDASSRVMYLVAQVDVPYNTARHNPILRFGQFVEADIFGNDTQSLFVLPRHVLRLDNTVLTVSDNNQIEIQPVDVVRTTATQVFIKDGLSDGQDVVFSVVPNPYNGMAVRRSDDSQSTPPSENPITQTLGADGVVQ
ncbi:efflux RND transporter periplasmic adaptor subunit [Alteromonas sp. C1M14]|uniref:efflux RND transporter periplasmic adaptor subunit n=1 Tax=Alteromonas sp. C1M14 TaxID=2841567 RepID=UPI001C09283B|nr:efflux RND transporter periplasmic adaptor subunit [Alteromonas sp. C1M14]MBU2976757.1 efflux RND transporter periplasmic adaptor subunit [Alteromonas sp. C1M14]